MRFLSEDESVFETDSEIIQFYQNQEEIKTNKAPDQFVTFGIADRSK